MNEVVNAILDADLPPALQVTLMEVYRQSENGLFLGTHSEVAEARGVSRGTVSSQIRTLKERGYLKGKRHSLRVMIGDSVSMNGESVSTDGVSVTENGDTASKNGDSTSESGESDVSPEGKKKSSIKEKTHTPSTSAPAPRARARGDDSPGPFDVEIDSVDAITEAAFGDPIRGLAVKEQIDTYCERAGPEGWDCLRSVCALIDEKGWNPTAQLVKKKLTDQLKLLKESNDTDAPDDFASKAQRILDAAGKGAGAY